MKTILKYFLLLGVLLTSPLFARTKLQGIVEKGGQSIITSGLQSTTLSVRTFPSATVTVYIANTLTLATIYSDAAGTLQSNPFTASTDASWTFFIDDGTYDIKFSPSGFTAWTLSTVSVGSNTASVVAPPPSGGDDYAVLQTLITEASSTTLSLQFQRGIYLSSAELQVTSLGPPPVLHGVPSLYNITPTPDGTVIRATTLGQRSVLANLTNDSIIEDLWLDANDKAIYGLYMNNAAFSTYKRIMCEHAVIDGWHDNANCGTSYFEQIKGQFNGRTYVTSGISAQYANRKTVIAGTATITSGSVTIPIAAGTDLTTLGIRKNDLVRVGAVAATSFYGAIESVTAATITLQTNTFNRPVSTLAGQPFAIGVGDGFHHSSDGNNNINTLVSPFMRQSGGNGFGLHWTTTYGDTIIGSQSDFNNFFSYSVGSSDNLATVFGGAIIRPYTEADIAGSMFIGSGVDSLAIEAPLLSSTPEFAGAFLGGGSVSIWRKGYVESLQKGAPQNFIFEITNTGGTLQHRFLSDRFVPTGTDSANKIPNATGALTNTPSVSNVVGFAAGAGILAATPEYLIFDTPNAQNGAPSMQATMEFNSTGVNYLVGIEPLNTNVNGVTINRFILRLTNPTTGGFFQWNTTNIPAGTILDIRVNGLFR